YTWLNLKFCSSKCANSRSERKLKTYEKICPVCDKVFHTRFRKITTCSLKCNGVVHGSNISGDKHPSWSGGKVKTRQGYIRMWVADDHPFVSMRAKGTNHILEHRLVMAEKIGRPLYNHETVHHKNGVR